MGWDCFVSNDINSNVRQNTVAEIHLTEMNDKKPALPQKLSFLLYNRRLFHLIKFSIKLPTVSGSHKVI